MTTICCPQENSQGAHLQVLWSGESMWSHDALQVMSLYTEQNLSQNTFSWALVLAHFLDRHYHKIKTGYCESFCMMFGNINNLNMLLQEKPI